jgi:transcriptional regulator with XRE-family HTH domain
VSDVPDDFGRRIKAARAYAGEGTSQMSQATLAAEIGVSTGTLKALEAGTRAVKDFEAPGVIARVSEATGLPPGFFSIDWSLLRGAESLGREDLEMLGDLREYVSELLDRINLADQEGLLVTLTRRAQERLADQPESAEPGTEAAGSTRGGDDATEEAGRPRDEETRRSARRRAQ